MKKILVLLGPNLNLVGVREKGVYGEESAEDIEKQIVEYANKNNYDCDVYQSNWEGALIDKLHEARTIYDAVIVNAGALTHYSYALRDAIAAIKIPCLEIHMSNIHAREDFRHNSVIAPVCKGSVIGFGKYGYFMCIDALKYLV